MKNKATTWICLTFVFGFILGCTGASKKKLKLNQDDSNVNVQKSLLDTSHSIEVLSSFKSIDSIEVKNFPVGNKLQFKTFTSNKNVFDVDDEGYFKTVNINNKLFNYRQPNFSYSYDIDYFMSQADVIYSKNNLDSPFYFFCRLPNINPLRVCLLRSSEMIFDNDYMVDLILVDSLGKIINSLSVSRSHGSNSGWDNKSFLISEDYIIQIKYSILRDENTNEKNFFIKYKILPSGEIVRWYDIENGDCKTDIEEGQVKNHMREGKWKEFFGKGQKDAVFSYCEYKDGMPQGEQTFYDLKNPNKVKLRINAKTKEVLEEGE